jgi:hypothetical protein
MATRLEIEMRAGEMEAAAQGTVAPRWIPHQAFLRQRIALEAVADELLYGGQASGGKSDYLLMAALEYVDVPGYAALILRRSFTDLSLPGAIMERAQGWLKGTPARWSGETKTWTFPSGATLTFGYLESEGDKYRYQSAEFQYCGFDELTQFSDTQYTYLFSRLRRPTMPCVRCGEGMEMRASDGVWAHEEEGGGEGEREEREKHEAEADTIIMREYPQSKERNLSIFQVPLRMRSGTNPGGYGAEWVRNRFIPDDFTPEKAIEARVWEKEAAIENEETKETEIVRTSFVPSRKDDNPYADKTTYARSLAKMGYVERMQLGSGDWSITASGRMRFDLEAIGKYEAVAGTEGEIFMERGPSGGMVAMFRPRRNGIVSIWKRPERGRLYVIGSDTAQGRDVNRGEGTARGDFSVDQVRDVDTGEQVARLRARISERAHAEQLSMLATWYNMAFVVPEVAGGYGTAMLDHLILDLGYPMGHVYRREGGQSQTNQKEAQLSELGFVTGRTSKPQLISGLDSAILFRSIETYDVITINEYKTYEQSDNLQNGGTGARVGCFDDCVIADALCVLGIGKYPASLRQQANKKRPQVVRYAIGGGTVPRNERERAAEENRMKQERMERM